MTEAEAIALVAKAIRSGIFNDLGSGSNVDLCVISEGGKKVDYKRNYELLQGKTYSRQQPVIFEKGTARAPSTIRSLDSVYAAHRTCRSECCHCGCVWAWFPLTVGFMCSSKH